MTEKLGIYNDMPPGMYPVHMFYPKFQTLDLWFPALDAWVLEMLCEKAKKQIHLPSLHIMEIGSYVGTSTSILARHAAFLMCVDTWSGSGKENDEMQPLYDGRNVFQVWLENTGMFPKRPAFHKRTLNPDSLPEFLGDQRFDLIFIDGAHDYESVKADIKIAEQHIAPGGVICGHDFTGFKGVTQAAIEFELDEVCGTIWWKVME